VSLSVGADPAAWRILCRQSRGSYAEPVFSTHRKKAARVEPLTGYEGNAFAYTGDAEQELPGPVNGASRLPVRIRCEKKPCIELYQAGNDWQRMAN
jgi:hypothetical protein